jgi:hypothetical protein
MMAFTVYFVDGDVDLSQGRVRNQEGTVQALNGIKKKVKHFFFELGRSPFPFI